LAAQAPEIAETTAAPDIKEALLKLAQDNDERADLLARHFSSDSPGRD
jgi:hypothetical protein